MVVTSYYGWSERRTIYKQSRVKNKIVFLVESHLAVLKLARVVTKHVFIVVKIYALAGTLYQYFTFCFWATFTMCKYFYYFLNSLEEMMRDFKLKTCFSFCFALAFTVQ